MIYQLTTTQFSQPQSSPELTPQKQPVNEAKVMHADHQEQVEEPEVSSISRTVICRLGVVSVRSRRSGDCSFNYLRRADFAGAEDRITTSLSSRWRASAVGRSNLTTDGATAVSPVC